MRIVIPIVFSVLLLGCASTASYDCGWFSDEPRWEGGSVDPAEESMLLETVLRNRREPPLSSLEGGFQIYEADGYYLFCIPPRHRDSHPGCFAERYMLQKVDGEWVYLSNRSIVCT